MTKTFRNLCAGDIVQVGTARSAAHPCRFLGFTTDQDKYSETAIYPSWAELSQSQGVNSFPELLEKQHNNGKVYGHHFYARFAQLTKHGDVDYTWSAYLFTSGIGYKNVRWCLGSSAEVIRLGPVEPAPAPKPRPKYLRLGQPLVA